MSSPTRISLVLLLATGIRAFNAGRSSLPINRQMKPQSGNLSPLFYADIEPEIKSATIPSAIHFNGTSIFVQPTEAEVVEKEVVQTKKRPGRTRKSKSKGTSATATSTRSRKQSDKDKPTKSHRVTWQTHYKELIAYKEENGHCLVPQNNPSNPKLGLWVMQQRRQMVLQQTGKTSSLNSRTGKQRIILLDDIGFTWRVERRGPRGSYGNLRRMKDLHAHDTGDGNSGYDLMHVANFEKYMIEKSDVYSEEDKREAWKKRFEMFQ